MNRTIPFVVADKQGCKAVELVLALKEQYREVPDDDKEHHVLVDIESAVHAGEILEIEYTVPNIPDRIKSFYLPQGSTVLSITVDGRKLDFSKLSETLKTIGGLIL